MCSLSSAERQWSVITPGRSIWTEPQVVNACIAGLELTDPQLREHGELHQRSGVVLPPVCDLYGGDDFTSNDLSRPNEVVQNA